jgi:hypothetical protein
MGGCLIIILDLNLRMDNQMEEKASSKSWGFGQER